MNSFVASASEWQHDPEMKVDFRIVRMFPRAGKGVGLRANPRLYPHRDYVAWQRARFAGLDA